MTTITATDGKRYRIEGSTIPEESRFDRFRAALLAEGVRDHLNALPPRCSRRYVQLFEMANGTYRLADYGTLCRAARAAAQRKTLAPMAPACAECQRESAEKAGLCRRCFDRKRMAQWNYVEGRDHG